MKYASSQTGFSLVETLVSITILLVVIVGPLSISSSAAKSSSFSSEQVTAFFLAQEGAELAQKARDDLLFSYFAGTNPDPWADFTRTTSAGLYRNCFPDVNSGRLGCDFTIGNNSTGSLTLTTCMNNGTECLFYVDKTTSAVRSRYFHTTNPTSSTLATPFIRVVTFELVNADEVKVTSKVTWRTGSLKQEQQVVVETRLFNVYGY